MLIVRSLATFNAAAFHISGRDLSVAWSKWDARTYG